MIHSSMYFGVVAFLLSTLAMVVSEHATQTSQCVLDVADIVINKLNWKKAAVIYDRNDEFHLQDLQSLKVIVYAMNNSSLVTDILHEIHVQLFPDVNVIVALDNLQLLKKILFETDVVDFKTNHSTDWWHHSKWLVLSGQLFPETTIKLNLQRLQNIAILLNKEEQDGCSVDIVTSTIDVTGHRFERVDGTLISPQTVFPNTKYRYNRRPLRISAVRSVPFVVPKTSGNTDGIPYTGYFIEVLRMITESLNLTLEYVKPANGTWGWTDDGMVGQLRRREIDLVASEMTVHPTRAKYIDYITPFLQTGVSIIFYRMPQATEPIFLLARPYNMSVYTTYLAAACAVTVVFIVIETTSRLRCKFKRQIVLRLVWFMTRSSLKQGDCGERISRPGRILLVCWGFLVVLISSIYCSNLTATLAANSTLKKFQTIDEFLDSDFDAGFPGGGMRERFLSNSLRDDYKRLYEKAIRSFEKDPGVTSSFVEEHIQRAKEGNYGVFIYSLNVDNVVQSDCRLARLYLKGTPLESHTFAVQKHSPFKHDIDKVMQHLHSSGILKMTWDKWNNATGSRVCERDRHSFTMKELIGVVIATGIGLFVAFFALLMEWACVQIKPKYTIEL